MRLETSKGQPHALPTECAIDMKLDLNEMRLVFNLDDKYRGKCINIPKRTYYFFVSTCVRSKDIKFEIIDM